VVLQFGRDDLASLASHAPHVSAAMKAAGVAFVGKGAVSVGAIDNSQRARKCST